MQLRTSAPMGQLKRILMNAGEIRADLIERITNMDERFLQAMHLMAVAYDSRDNDPIVSYDIDGTSRIATELTSILDAEVEAARRGEYITIEDFKKESAQWAQTIK